MADAPLDIKVIAADLRKKATTALSIPASSDYALDLAFNAATPKRILALLDHLEGLEKRRDELAEYLHDNCVAMQCALIEAEHGRGADEGLRWISNTLAGPGLLPDENAPYGKEAQMWFNEHRAKPFPRCGCGRPSHILSRGKGFCSWACEEADAGRKPA